jgi:hypothetical protein
VIAWIGSTGGRLLRLADLAIRVRAQSIEQVEGAHTAIAHSLCIALRAQLRSHRTNTKAARLAARAGVAQPLEDTRIPESALEA